MTSIPPRLSESAFRRFEPWIASAVSGSLPTTVSIDGLNGETISARLRDAAKGFSLYCYPSDLVDRQLFLSIWPTLEVSNQGSHAIIRKRGAGKQVAQTPPGLHLQSHSGRMSLDVVRSIACLLSNKLLTDRVEIVGWTQPELEDLIRETEYDVAVWTEGHQIFII